MFRLERLDRILWLTLDRPEARNAVPAAGWEELAGLLGSAASSGAALLVLTGAGDAFCSGADLGDFEALRERPEAVARFRCAMREALDGLAGLACPTLAAIDGPCFGAGAALALACDLRIATPRARFAIPPARLGLSYPQADLHRLVTAIGPSQAARLLFTGEAVDAGEAVRIGLVDLIGETVDVDAMAQAIAGNEPESLASLKRGIGLAARGCGADEAQDRAFDRLLSGEALARRLAALRA